MMTTARRLLLMLVLTGPGAIAAAQGAVGVQPNAIILDAAPGGSVTQTLRLDNPGSNPLAITVYPGDWEFDGNGEIAYYPSSTLERSAADWISFDTASAELPGHEMMEISYTVQVPADAQPGTHWAALFIEGSKPGEDEDAPALASFRIRTAHMIYVNVPPVSSAGRITGILGSAAQTPAEPYRLQLNYLNEGNAVQILNGVVEIRTVQGELVDTIPVERQLALPGAASTLDMELYGPLPAADYLALAILNYGDTSRDVAGEFVFTLHEPLAEPQLYFDGAREAVGEGDAP